MLTFSFFRFSNKSKADIGTCEVGGAYANSMHAFCSGEPLTSSFARIQGKTTQENSYPAQGKSMFSCNTNA
jgi:hypothetical protein